MPLNTSKLRWIELGYDFKLNGMEAGTTSNEFSENLNAETRCSPTVSATYSQKLPKLTSIICCLA
jgi:hypothetical protein